MNANLTININIFNIIIELMAEEEFQLLIQEVIKENFQKDLDKITNIRNQLANKTIGLKEMIYEKLVSVKCKLEIDNISKFGKISMNKGEIKLTDFDDNIDVSTQISEFNECYVKNSLDIHKMSNSFSDDIEKNTDLFYNLLGKCNSNDKKEAKDCIAKAVNISMKNMVGIIVKYNGLITEKINMLV